MRPRADSAGKWRLIPLAAVSLAPAWLLRFSDAQGWGVVGGAGVRAVDLALLAVGAVGRVGPMLRFGDRFTWPLAAGRWPRSASMRS